jgi:adenosylcobinamide-GDP ribazoletransferase
MWSHFGTALSFLTLFRLPFTSAGTLAPQELAESFSYFPLVGLTLGFCYAAPAYALSGFMPALLLAVLITALTAVLTRALHLDGLADLADGVGGGYTPERRLEIMKDSRTGAFGALAIALAVAFKVAALDALILRKAFPAVLLVPVFSRFAMVLAAYRSPYARKEGGLGKPFLDHIARRHVLTAFLLTAVTALLVQPVFGLCALALASGSVLALRLLCRRWIGGITGDALGAINEIVEILLFSAAACMV